MLNQTKKQADVSPETLLAEWVAAGLLPPEQQATIQTVEQQNPVSLHWELRAILYVGITLLSLGLGLLVYDHFDQIGHTALLIAIAAGCLGCFAYAWRFRPVWAWQQVPQRNAFTDYALLLGCLLFLTLEGYVQYQYNLFGTRYGLATLLPALLFWPLAYRFDHRGVLGMALAALISWVGVTVRPLNLYLKTNFFDERNIWAAIALGFGLIALGFGLERRRVKPHFTWTYITMAGNLILIALLGGLFNFESQRWFYAVGLLAVCIGLDVYARRQRRIDTASPESSFLFLLMSAVYGYIGLTYLFFKYLRPDSSTYYWYFILTGSALVYYLIRQLPRNR